MCTIVQNGELKPYNSKGNERYWEVLSTYKINYKKGGKSKKLIHSVKNISNGEVVSIGDMIALTWYPPFSIPHIIKEFIIEDNEMYVRYDERSMWCLSSTRRVSIEGISNVIRSIC